MIEIRTREKIIHSDNPNWKGKYLINGNRVTKKEFFEQGLRCLFDIQYLDIEHPDIFLKKE